MDVRIAEDWKAVLKDEFEKPYFAQLVEFVKKEYSAGTVYPSGKNIFAESLMRTQESVIFPTLNIFNRL